MKICYICSRYADPDINNRRRNIAEARALALWAEGQGYAVVCWWASIDPTDPPCDSDEDARRAALGRSAALAAMVGEMGGDIVTANWYPMTDGMSADYHEWFVSHVCCGGVSVRAPRHEVEPYYTAPTETVPRAKVQAAVDDIEALRKRQSDIYGDHEFLYHKGADESASAALKTTMDHTGVTPTEVTP